MSARFEIEAMRIALGEMLARLDRIEEELEKVKVKGEGDVEVRSKSEEGRSADGETLGKGGGRRTEDIGQREEG